MSKDPSPLKRTGFHLIWLLIIFLSQGVLSQNPIVANASLAEKIYLQVDRKLYASNETIWFKAVVVSAANHMPNSLSGVLHVELIGPDGEIAEKKLVEIKNGIGDNFFELHDTHIKGKYLIRAYTEWNRNFGDDFIFRTYINVFPSSAPDVQSVITDVDLTEEDSGEFRLRARVDPQLLDTLHNGNLNIFLSLDEKRDTISVKRNQEGFYLLDYKAHEDSRIATLVMETENCIRRAKTEVLNEALLDVQFMPESGELVHGLTNLVGVKVLDQWGKGRSVEGEVVDDEGKAISTFKTNHLGMGKFYIRADKSSNYYGTIPSASAKGSAMDYSLPAVIARGSTLSVTKRNDVINLMVSSNYQEQDSIFIQASCRGIAYYVIKGQLKQGQVAFQVSGKGLPAGIIAFTLLDHAMQPTAERLFFNERPQSRLNIEVSTDKPVYHQREKIAVDVLVTTSNGKAAKANTSMLVMNKAEMGSVQSTRENILSELLLDSELQGELEDPAYYFRSENETRQNDLDALLLTQGWRRYNYTEPPQDSLLFEPEITLNVTGTVDGIFSKNNIKEGIGISLMTFGSSPSLSVQETDSLGRFYFPLNEERGHRLNILLQSTNKSGRNRNYTISLQEGTSPKILYDHREAAEEQDVLVDDYIRKYQNRNAAYDDFDLSAEVNRLNEVVLDGYKITPNRKKVMDSYGKPDSVIDGNSIQEKEQDWSYGLYSVLASNFPKDIRFKRTGGVQGYMKAEVVGGDETVILIDGIPIREDDFPLIPNIPTSEVKSVEIIRHVQNFHNLYRDVYPESSAQDAPMWGSIIAIYTLGGTGILGAQKPVGVLKASVPVFSPHREFYAPKYVTQNQESPDQPDLRTTIHWEPRINSSAAENSSSTTFYNSDSTGEMLIIIEAISEDGEIGYGELIYEVKKGGSE